jgi:hypothetical protein
MEKSMQAHGFGERVESRFVEISPWLLWVRSYCLGIDLDQEAVAALVARGTGEQRLEPAAEPAAPEIPRRRLRVAH